MVLVGLFSSAIHPRWSVRHSLPDLRASAGEAISFSLPQYFHCYFASCLVNASSTSVHYGARCGSLSRRQLPGVGRPDRIGLCLPPSPDGPCCRPDRENPNQSPNENSQPSSHRAAQLFLLNSIHSLPHPIRNIPWQRCIMQLRRESLAIGQDPS